PAGRSRARHRPRTLVLADFPDAHFNRRTTLRVASPGAGGTASLCRDPGPRPTARPHAPRPQHLLPPFPGSAVAAGPLVSRGPAPALHLLRPRFPQGLRFG